MDETSAVFHELLDEMRSLERTMLDHPQSLTDEQSRCEIYKWVFSITQVAFDRLLHRRLDGLCVAPAEDPAQD